MTTGVRVLIAEGDEPTRAGLRLVVRRAGFEAVDDAGGHAAALGVAREHRPDVALVAADLPGGGIETARQLIDLYPSLRLIVMSTKPGGAELVAAVLAGASGYLAKEMSLERLPHAIEGVLRGEVALPRQHTDHLLAELRGREARRQRLVTQTGAKLTDREWEVLQMLGEGALTADIARRLRISEVTVRRHASSVVTKLGVADRAGATRLLARSAD